MLTLAAGPRIIVPRGDHEIARTPERRVCSPCYIAELRILAGVDYAPIRPEDVPDPDPDGAPAEVE